VNSVKKVIAFTSINEMVPESQTSARHDINPATNSKQVPLSDEHRK